MTKLTQVQNLVGRGMLELREGTRGPITPTHFLQLRASADWAIQDLPSGRGSKITPSVVFQGLSTQLTAREAVLSLLTPRCPGTESCKF